MMLEDEKVEKLVNDLTKPMFIYRMARAQAGRDDAMGKGARTRMANAVEEIDKIVRAYK